jgi:hypothetical protein
MAKKRKDIRKKKKIRKEEKFWELERVLDSYLKGGCVRLLCNYVFLRSLLQGLATCLPQAACGTLFLFHAALESQSLGETFCF